MRHREVPKLTADGNRSSGSPVTAAIRGARPERKTLGQELRRLACGLAVLATLPCGGALHGEIDVEMHWQSGTSATTAVNDRLKVLR
jgi:hypothetical protein